MEFDTCEIIYFGFFLTLTINDFFIRACFKLIQLNIALSYIYIAILQFHESVIVVIHKQLSNVETNINGRK